MTERTKENLLVTAFGVGLFAALMNLPAVLDFGKRIVDLVLPIVAGGILALFVNVPVNGIEKRLRKRLQSGKRPLSDKALHAVSFGLTLLLILLILFVVLTMLAPEIVRSSQRLYAQIKASVPGWLAYLDGHGIDAQWLENLLAGIDPERAGQHLSAGLDTILANAVGAVSSTVSVTVTTAFALIISIYMTLGKASLCRHARKLTRAYLKPAWAEGVFHFCQVFSRSFANFLSGQCVEAVILGMLMLLSFKLFRLPYGSLVGVLTAVCAIIPYVGAFISFAVSVILTLLVDPSLVIRCLVVYGAVQLVENQFIYPKVVGGSVGLPPLYTLIAAMIGGKLFGIIGIIFFIPLAAVAAEIVKEDAEKRLSGREDRTDP